MVFIIAVFSAGAGRCGQSSVLILLWLTASLCQGGWYKGNTHMHTTRSDGNEDPNTVAEWYYDNDYDFINVTDHSSYFPPDVITIIPQREYLVISGEELNNGNCCNSNHMTAFNTTGKTGDFPRSTDSQVEYIQMQVDLVHEQNGLAFLNHPTWARLVPAATILQVDNLEHFELLNGCQDTDSWGIYDDGSNWPSTEAIWDEVLTGGKRLYGVGADDAHSYTGGSIPGSCNPMTAWTMVQAEELTVEALRSSYLTGNFYASNGVMLKQVSTDMGLYYVEIDQEATLHEVGRRDSLGTINSARPVMEGEPGFRIEFIGEGGEVLHMQQGEDTASFQLTREIPYARARAVYLREIPPDGAPYDSRLGQAGYVADNNITREEYYAWCQPIFSDDRRIEGPPVFGCMDPGYREYDSLANLPDPAACLNVNVYVRAVQGPQFVRGSSSIHVRIAPEVGAYHIEVFTLKGKSVKRVLQNADRSHVISGLASYGNYLVKITGAHATLVKRVLLF
jgi:hypothetical protein